MRQSRAVAKFVPQHRLEKFVGVLHHKACNLYQTLIAIARRAASNSIGAAYPAVFAGDKYGGVIDMRIGSCFCGIGYVVHHLNTDGRAGIALARKDEKRRSHLFNQGVDSSGDFTHLVTVETLDLRNLRRELQCEVPRIVTRRHQEYDNRKNRS